MKKNMPKQSLSLIGCFFAKVDLSVHPPVLREEVIANDLEDHR